MLSKEEILDAEHKKFVEEKGVQNQDKWISCKDEFPEHDSSVLVAFDNGDVVFCVVCTIKVE